jgi:hypothetical protein
VGNEPATDQLRALKREGGEEAGFAADAYLSILDHFLNETAPSGSASNSPGSSTMPKQQSDQEEN